MFFDWNNLSFISNDLSSPESVVESLKSEFRLKLNVFDSGLQTFDSGLLHLTQKSS